jgi:hypothetical protein
MSSRNIFSATRPGLVRLGEGGNSGNKDLSHISVPFLAVNIVGTGLVLFVANLWSQVFAKWMDRVKQDTFIFTDKEGNTKIIDPNAEKGESLKQGLWVALVATFLAVFVIWALIKTLEASHKEWKSLKGLFT